MDSIDVPLFLHEKQNAKEYEDRVFTESLKTSNPNIEMRAQLVSCMTID